MMPALVVACSAEKDVVKQQKIADLDGANNCNSMCVGALFFNPLLIF